MTGGLALAVEGPSKAEISCHDNKDGTVSVSYLPTAPGEYKITVKFGEKHIKGSPYNAKITGENRNIILLYTVICFIVCLLYVFCDDFQAKEENVTRSPLALAAKYHSRVRLPTLIQDY